MIRTFLKAPYSECIMESRYPRFLMFTRLFSMVFLIFLLTSYLIMNTGAFFLFLTDWGLTFTTLYFILINLNYKIPKMHKLCIVFLHTLWNLEFLISIIFWTSLYVLSFTDDITFIMLSVPTHGILVILVGFDLWLSKAYCRRIWVIVPCFICLIYGLSLNLPYTIAVKPIYPSIKYTNITTYLIFIYTMILLSLSNEICCRATRRRRRVAYEREHAMLEPFTIKI